MINRHSPAGVASIVLLFFLAAIYIGTLGALMLVFPGTVSMAWGAPLLGGLELAGPYMFLLLAGAGAAVGWGLHRLQPWARRAALLVAFAGLAMLLPTVSAAVFEFRARPVIWGGLGVIIRVIIVWYLCQESVAEVFRRTQAVRTVARRHQ